MEFTGSQVIGELVKYVDVVQMFEKLLELGCSNKEIEQASGWKSGSNLKNRFFGNIIRDISCFLKGKYLK